MEEIKRDAFIFDRLYHDAIKELSDQDQLIAYKSIFDYALDGIEPTLTGVPAAVFILVKPTLEKGRRKAVKRIQPLPILDTQRTRRRFNG